MARARRVDVATVRLWDRDVGAVAWNAGRGLGEFEYDPAFIRQGLEIAPLMLPLREGVASFPALNRDTFHGLPGLLADALPDRFGNRIIDAWLARQGAQRRRLHTGGAALLHGRARHGGAGVQAGDRPQGRQGGSHRSGRADRARRRDLQAPDPLGCEPDGSPGLTTSRTRERSWIASSTWSPAGRAWQGTAAWPPASSRPSPARIASDCVDNRVPPRPVAPPAQSAAASARCSSVRIARGGMTPPPGPA